MGARGVICGPLYASAVSTGCWSRWEVAVARATGYLFSSCPCTISASVSVYRRGVNAGYGKVSRDLWLRFRLWLGVAHIVEKIGDVAICFRWLRTRQTSTLTHAIYNGRPATRCGACEPPWRWLSSNALAPYPSSMGVGATGPERRRQHTQPLRGPCPGEAAAARAVASWALPPRPRARRAWGSALNISFLPIELHSLCVCPRRGG